jgi:hypothetical protein
MKSNPYDPAYVMNRDQCSMEDALEYIKKLKEKNAWSRGKKIKNRPSPYDPSYIMVRDGCTYDEAVIKVRDYKANKATSINNFIKRYGEIDGTQRYNEWKSKSLEKGYAAVKKNGASQSKLSPSYYIRHGHSESDAAKMALDYQYNNSPLHIQYYIKRNKSLEYARKKIREIHDKKIGRDSYREYLKKTTNLTYDEITEKIRTARGHFSVESLGQEKFDERSKKIRKTFEETKRWVPLSDLSDYALYRKIVWEQTNKNDLSSLENFENRGRAGVIGAYHLDHKFSISRGYIDGVSPELIGSINNLEFIPWEENVRKQGDCSITKEELKNDEN